MTDSEWNKVSRYFKPHEFDSPDSPGSGRMMQWGFMERLFGARQSCERIANGDIVFSINSGIRTPEHNRDEGGVYDSAHLSGWAVDIRTRNNYERFIVLACLLLNGFMRIGIGKGFIHVDNDPDKTPFRCWLYVPKSNKLKAAALSLFGFKNESEDR